MPSAAAWAKSPHPRNWGGHQRAPSQPGQGGHCIRRSKESPVAGRGRALVRSVLASKHVRSADSLSSRSITEASIFTAACRAMDGAISKETWLGYRWRTWRRFMRCERRDNEEARDRGDGMTRASLLFTRPTKLGSSRLGEWGTRIYKNSLVSLRMVPEKHRSLAGVEPKGGPVKPTSRYRRVPPERDEEPGLHHRSRVFPSYNLVEKRAPAEADAPAFNGYTF